MCIIVYKQEAKNNKLYPIFMTYQFNLTTSTGRSPYVIDTSCVRLLLPTSPPASVYLLVKYAPTVPLKLKEIFVTKFDLLLCGNFPNVIKVILSLRIVFCSNGYSFPTKLIIFDHRKSTQKIG